MAVSQIAWIPPHPDSRKLLCLAIGCAVRLCHSICRKDLLQTQSISQDILTSIYVSVMFIHLVKSSFWWKKKIQFWLFVSILLIVDSFQSLPPWYWSSDYSPTECCNKWSCYKRYLKKQPFPCIILDEQTVGDIVKVIFNLYPRHCCQPLHVLWQRLQWDLNPNGGELGGYVMQWEHVSAQTVRLLTFLQFRCKAKYSITS